ncbi:amidohydrolase family protein [Caldovatus aquaticus]|uniref:Amidohydrolase family protein n=1 Tax=Caldovatus aquaticus TaxID=2865671 RepID=A0ABS7EX76_9PROT|nr:amidohydrolase family protein [Caldovatus aquaticus]MBW8267965.1 amidohydrolase family protein [Caldovatus aquaticus]
MSEPTNHYGPTAARAHGRPGRETRPASVTIDIHSHVLVPEAAAFAAPHLDLSTIPLAHFATPETQALNRKQDADRREVMTAIAPRLRDLDAAGIDLQVVAPPPPQCYFTLRPEHAVPAIRMVNDGIAAFVARRPDRFVGLGTVPMQEPAEAVRELERCMGPLGFKGVQILTNVAGRELSDPAFAPFWAAAERLGALVMLHPNGFTEGERFRRFYFNNVIGNPLDTAVALHYLIFDGVLERHPGLKILAVHGGGYLPAYSGRIDHAWGARSDARGSLPKPPTHYLRQVWFDSIVFTPHQLDHLVRVFGADRIVMGTDYPYDMAESDPIGHVCSVEGFDAATRAAICGGNAQRLLGL